MTTTTATQITVEHLEALHAESRRAQDAHDRTVRGTPEAAETNRIAFAAARALRAARELASDDVLDAWDAIRSRR